jgi:hypothetical protein
MTMTMERNFDAQPPAVANAPPTERPAASLLSEVLARWPTAPVAGVGESGRWLRFERPDGGTVYLQRYAWDDRSVPHYLVVRPTEGDGAEQHRCAMLEDAIATVRRLLVSRPAHERRGPFDAIARLVDGASGAPAVQAA